MCMTTNIFGANIYERQKLILSPCTTMIKTSRRREKEDIPITLRLSTFINGIIIGSFGKDLSRKAKQSKEEFKRGSLAVKKCKGTCCYSEFNT